MIRVNKKKKNPPCSPLRLWCAKWYWVSSSLKFKNHQATGGSIPLPLQIQWPGSDQYFRSWLSKSHSDDEAIKEPCGIHSPSVHQMYLLVLLIAQVTTSVAINNTAFAVIQISSHKCDKKQTGYNVTNIDYFTKKNYPFSPDLNPTPHSYPHNRI